jgi:hypothetical protein
MGSFLFPTVARFLLPLVAFVLMLLTGEINGSIAVAAGLSLIVTAVAGLVGFFFLRGEHSARRLGAKAARPLSWIPRGYKWQRMKAVAQDMYGARAPGWWLPGWLDRLLHRSARDSSR